MSVSTRDFRKEQRTANASHQPEITESHLREGRRGFAVMGAELQSGLLRDAVALE